MSIVRGQYDAKGIPESLTSFERMEALNIALELRVMLDDPPGDVDRDAAELFRGTLDSIINDLLRLHVPGGDS